MRVLVINGPNLNMLGVREKELYGEKTYTDLVRYTEQIAEDLGINVKCFQSNHEGVIVEEIQNSLGKFDGIVINAAAYSHTSIAILDALKAVNLPTVEVHLTDLTKREKYRQFSYISEFAFKTISGKGFEGYKQALVTINNYMKGAKI